MDVILSPVSGLPLADMRLLALALLHRENKQGESWPSLDTLQADTGLPRRRVVQAIGALEEATGPVRLNVVRRCRKDGPGRAPNIYRLTVELSARVGLNSPADLSAAPGLKLSTELSAPSELNSRELSANLSSKLGRAEFQKPVDLSSDVDPGTHSGNSPKEPTQRESARERALAPPPVSGSEPQKTSIPERLVPGPEAQEIASRKGLDLGRELKRFVWHARAKGLMSQDWQSTLCMWLDAAHTRSERVLGTRSADLSEDGKRAHLQDLPDEDKITDEQWAENRKRAEEAQKRLRGLSKGLLRTFDRRPHQGGKL